MKQMKIEVAKFMKTRMNIVGMALTLLALLFSAHTASAYYDPGVQRWVNRDPMGERGFEVLRDPISYNGATLLLRRKAGSNPFEFVVNDAPNQHDEFGLLPQRDTDPDDKSPFGHWKRPHPYDPSCPDDRADLRDCFKQAKAYDDAVYKKSGDHLSSEEFMKVVRDCMKDKGHQLPGEK